MDTLLPLLFVVVLTVIYAATLKSSSDRLLCLLVVLVLVMLFCYFHLRQSNEGFIGAPIDYKLGTCGGINLLNKESALPVTGYDGRVIKGSGRPDYPLLNANKVAYHSPVGDAYAYPRPPMVRGPARSCLSDPSKSTLPVTWLPTSSVP